jgi:hypothetical protein
MFFIPGRCYVSTRIVSLVTRMQAKCTSSLTVDTIYKNVNVNRLLTVSLYARCMYECTPSDEPLEISQNTQLSDCAYWQVVNCRLDSRPYRLIRAVGELVMSPWSAVSSDPVVARRRVKDAALKTLGCLSR